MENFIVSARKYRPASFDTVVGQLAITSTLRNAIVNHQLAQAYLFTGPRGVGKTTCARIFAKTINCMNLQPNAEPCNECESCKAFNAGRSLNIHELDAASNNSVDDIRGLVEQVRILPQIGKYSVYIIDEVHMLSTSAFNAFLKTLEEPPAHAIFILATTEKHKILPTILSRCQIYDFNRMKVGDTVEHLKYISAKEGITAEETALDVIAQKADGAMRDALSIFDQVVSFCGKNLTYDKVIENLNVLDYDYYFRLTDLFFQGKVSDSLLVLNEIIEKGFDCGNLVSGLGKHFRDVLVSKDPATVQLLEVSATIKARYARQAEVCSVYFLYEALRVVEQCEMQYKVRMEKRLCVELAFIKLCQLNELKKKNLRASDFEALLKIAGFNGKFREPEAEPESVVENVPVVKRPADVNRPRPDSSFKIKDSFRQESQVQPVVKVQPVIHQQEKPDTRESFDEAKVVAALEKYITEHTPEQTVSIALKTHRPVIEGEKIVLLVDNQIQLEKVEAIRMHLQNMLMKNLKNGYVTFEFKLFDSNTTQEEKKLFTASEKFEHFMKLNPVVADLKNIFGLELE